jgi:hypothetical protein
MSLHYSKLKRILQSENKRKLNSRNYLSILQGLHLDLEDVTCKTNNDHKGTVLGLDGVTLRFWQNSCHFHH